MGIDEMKRRGSRGSLPARFIFGCALGDVAVKNCSANIAAANRGTPMSISSNLPRRHALAAAFACTLLLAAPAATLQAANNAEQVVFSGVGVPPVSSEPFGFWVWCQVEPASTHSHYDT